MATSAASALIRSPHILISGFTLLAIFPLPLSAAEDVLELQRVEVTGSRIKRAEMEGISPIVILDREKILNPEGLRYENEFVRHKVLDCMGDLSLLGMPFVGHIVAYKSGHALNHALLKRFIDQKSCWETVEATDAGP